MSCIERTSWLDRPYKLGILRVLMLSACAVAAMPVSAQSPAPLPPSAATLEAAFHLLEVSNYDQQVAQSVRPAAMLGFDKTIGDLTRTRGGQALPDDLLQRLKQKLNLHLDAIMPKFIADTRTDAALVYATYFNAEELDRLAVLQSDPVMKKAQTLMQIMPQLMKIRSMIFSNDKSRASKILDRIALI
ncbi:MAG: hypothetical protein U5J78_00190 [Parasphingorhabdus sp.]|nr:hypothetical protein [Parasphingorhabdus sp.]